MQFFKNFFKKETQDIPNPKELSEIFNSRTMKYEDLEPIESFDNNKFNVLIADDNEGATELIKFEVDVVLGKKEIVKSADLDSRIVNVRTIKNLIENNKVDVDIKKIGGDYALFKLDKSLDQENSRIDYAIIDILFGGIVIKDGNKFVLNGIDIAKKIHQKNPQAKIILFTGCDLESNEVLRTSIIDYFGEDFYKNNIVIKSPFFGTRLEKYSSELIKSLHEFVKCG